VEAAFGVLIGVATAGGTAAVLFLGVRHVQSGLMTLGDLLLIMAYLAQLYAPLKTLSNAPAKFASALASAERAFALLDQTPDVLEPAQPRPLARARGAVAFRHVSFSYETDRKVLDGISFELDPGARLGIAGMTGAGKTTLVNLLTRFYDPTAGAICLDGVDLRDYRLADLRDQFAIVLQEPVLFSTTIAENIAYARPAASQDAIIWAARAANADEFIRHFPHGYDTLVGERGMRLSGGERQRISLARAFLKDAPILILDEPTSSVDVRVEALIIEAMEQLMRGRTTLLISHRLTLLEKCDRLLLMENGRVARMTSDVAGAIREVLAHPSRS
jgi:ATP-binding cassette subfamily B protein